MDPDEGPWSREIEVGDARVLVQVHSGLELARMQCSCDAGPMPCWHMEAADLSELPDDDLELLDFFDEVRYSASSLSDALDELRGAQEEEDRAYRAEIMPPARAAVRDAERDLRDACLTLVRGINGYPSAGGPTPRRGWPEGTTWIHRTSRELRELSVLYTKSWSADCAAQVDYRDEARQAAEEAAEEESEEPGGGLCCMVGIVAALALLVWLLVL